uniref:Netrin-1 n=1 Tax=Meara stichopi TaxID=84115 RepID=A0A2P1DVC2_9BILA|nr:netrin protein [Meara stichopi]
MSRLADLCHFLSLLTVVSSAFNNEISSYVDAHTYGNGKPEDPCYGSDGKGRHCIPDFVNAAFNHKVTVSSTCGNPPNRYCWLTKSEGATIEDKKKCLICDSKNPKRSHGASYLTDISNSNNLTYWISEPFSNLEQDPGNVTLILPLGKKYEITYVSIQFYSPRPESMVIYKSKDFGVTWMPFQYYSSNCKATFNKPVKTEVTKFNEHEAFCSQDKSSIEPLSGARIAFASLQDRPSAYDFENSPVLKEWVTATDIKVVLYRMNTFPYELKEPYDFNYYAIADFSVGGRCKCNGHASSCIKNNEGKMVCDCKHNTAGPDCERCKEFHFDKPWRHATGKDTHQCAPCNCNLHARKCRFNMEIYKLSGSVSGGVCINCKHNTFGRNCDYCKEGFYRDNTKDITSSHCCRDCNCHPVGASGKVCNQTSGQCPCKEGVSGLNCNRCGPGFQQSRSHIAPCIQIPVSTADSGKNNNCPKRCHSEDEKITLKKYCINDYAISVEVLEKTKVNEWTKYTISVLKASKISRNRIKKGDQSLFVKHYLTKCKCPQLKLGKRYLIFGKDDVPGSGGNYGMTIDEKSLVFKYKSKYDGRLKQFSRKERKNKCKKYS